MNYRILITLLALLLASLACNLGGGGDMGDYPTYDGNVTRPGYSCPPGQHMDIMDTGQRICRYDR